MPHSEYHDSPLQDESSVRENRRATFERDQVLYWSGYVKDHQQQ